MYILKNALRNLSRNRGRNILLALVLLAIITTSAVGLIINNTSSGIIDDYKARFGSEVTIVPDGAQMQSVRRVGGGPVSGYTTSGGGGNRPDPIKPQQHLAFADSEYLLYTTMSAAHMVGCDESTSSLTAYGADQDNAMGGLRMSGMDNEAFIMPQFRLMGGQWEDFDNGEREIVDGRMAEADDECVVSQEFAETNGLSVGDVITVGGTAMPTPGRDTEELTNTYYTLTVTGIYFDMTEEDSTGMFASSLMNRRNEILTTFGALAEPLQDGETGASVSATYYLKDPAMLEAFEAEVRGKGLSDEYLVSTDKAGYDKVVEPVVGMKKITLTFLIIVLILGAIILLLLSSIAIRERKYEIGVLRAMGMKKGKVALGLWLELLTITCVCVALGLLAGTLAAQPVSNMLLNSQLESIQNAAGQGGQFGTMLIIGGRAMTQHTALDTLDVSLGAATLLQIIGIAVALATTATLASVLKITQYEPIKILMERN